jgi:NCAIR mutase (PurE)-related protein
VTAVPGIRSGRELLGARDTTPAGNCRRHAQGPQPCADFGPFGAVSGHVTRAASQMFAASSGSRPGTALSGYDEGMPRPTRPTGRGRKADAPAGFSTEAVHDLLTRVADGKLSVDEASRALRGMPVEELGFASLDHHRAHRKGFPEVIFCQGKSPAQVAEIAARLAERSPVVLGTRASAEHFKAARRRVKDLQYDEIGRTIWIDRDPGRRRLPGVALVAAGTSDLRVAEEAARTLDLLGHHPERIYDVGVAGLHRLVRHTRSLQDADVVIVVAGMEGALPSVIGGLVAAPVIAVPTSIGYGASFGGLTALLAMLNSCASGVSVVNIDNGFGAAYQAAAINRRIHGQAGRGDREHE